MVVVQKAEWQPVRAIGLFIIMDEVIMSWREVRDISHFDSAEGSEPGFAMICWPSLKAGSRPREAD
jgi:hypothetical protein